MGSLSWEEQTKWRQQVKNEILSRDCDKIAQFFDPTLYYNFEHNWHKTEKEPYEFDLYNLRKSDLVIVNFNDPKSIGTACELILAKELHIPVIGVNENKVDLHPWLCEAVTRMCDSIEELIEHVIDFYLN